MHGDDERRATGARNASDPAVEALRRSLYAGAPDAAAVRRYEQLAAQPAAGDSATSGARAADPHSGGLQPVRQNRRIVVAALVAIAFVVGSAAGGIVVAGLHASPAATRGAHAVARATAEADAGLVLRATSAQAIFDTPQTASDRRPSALPASQLVDSTFRQLGVIGDADMSLYVARGVDRRYCLVDVSAARTFVASCASEASFARSPLTLDLLLPTAAESRQSTVTAGTGQTPFVQALPANNEILVTWSMKAGVRLTYTHG